MKRMLNEASAFREEMIAGYASAYGRYLQRVPGASGVMANGMPARDASRSSSAAVRGTIRRSMDWSAKVLPPPPRSETSSRHPPASSAIE